MAERIGFLGLGTMGSAMAARLVHAGYEVVVWNRSRGHVDDLVALGAVRAESPADVLATGRVFSMLANEEVVRQIFTPELLEAAPAALVHFNMATISDRAAVEFESLHRQHGRAYVSSPVIGRPNVAARGELTILVAGDPALIDASMPMLEVMGRRVWNYGPSPSAANVVKIAVNYLIIHALQALAESITLLEHRDLDTHRFVEMINDSVFPGAVYGGYGHAIADQKYTPPGFSATLGLKDLLLAINAAKDAGVELPTSAVLREIFEITAREDGDNLDWAAVAEVTRRRSSPTN